MAPKLLIASPDLLCKAWAQTPNDRDRGRDSSRGPPSTNPGAAPWAHLGHCRNRYHGTLSNRPQRVHRHTTPNMNEGNCLPIKKAVKNT